MGKGLILIVALISFAGCATTKKVHRIEADDVTIHQSIQRIDDNKVDILSLLDSLYSVKSFTFDIFDTSKPDSLGNCPLLMHGTIDSETYNIVKRAETHEESTQSADSVYSYTEEKIIDSTQKERKERYYSLAAMLIVIASVFCFLKLCKYVKY